LLNVVVSMLHVVQRLSMYLVGVHVVLSIALLLLFRIPLCFLTCHLISIFSTIADLLLLLNCRHQ
jgi:hypothetical protein